MLSVKRILSPYVRPHLVPLVGGLVAIVFSKAPQMAQPKLLQMAIDHLQTGRRPPLVGRMLAVTGLGEVSLHTELLLYGASFLALALVYGGLVFLGRWYVINTSRRVEFDLRNALFDRLLTLSPRYYQKAQSGDIISRTTNDMDAVRMLIGPALMYSVNAVVAFAFALTLMFSISPKLALFSLAPFPVLMVVTKFVGNTVHTRFLTIQEKLGTLSARIQENLTGIRVVKAYAQEQHEIRKFGALNEDFVTSNERLIRVQAAFFPSMGFLAGCGLVVVLAYGGRMVIGQEISLGQLVQFAAYLAMLIWPTIAAGWVINMFQRGTASLRRISEVLDQVPDIADGPDTRHGARVTDGAIEIRDLSFAYEPGLPVLRNISLAIRARSTLGIVGPTGCGKTTLACLVARLYEPPAGTIFVDGTDVRVLPLRNLRSAVSFVPQDSFLFSDTIRENIRFGGPRQDQERVVRVAETAGLREEVESFPQAWETLLGERGLTLSGGQKQRTAIARALFVNSPILVLDDALSAVDTNTETIILANLSQELGRRTTIIIAHRLSAVKQADHIVYLEDGRIAEEGTHAELLALDGKYAELYRRQLLEQELEAA